MDEGEKVAVAPAGNPLTLKVTAFEKLPLEGATANV
jgi:hypothetical protein